MTSATLLSTFVEEQYGMRPVAMHPFSPNSWTRNERNTYRVENADGTQAVLRTYLPGWVTRMAPHEGFPDWLLTRAATLVFLEQQQYPAPRVIPALDDALVTKYGEWCALMTTYIEGVLAVSDVASLRLIGATLGRLHMLKPSTTTLGGLAVGNSWWELGHAVPMVLTQLAGLVDRVPSEWRAQLAAFRETLEYFEQGTEFPPTIIHADCWTGNAVQIGESRVVLIDWEFAGLGPAVLDLGGLLSNCHLDLPPFHADVNRITAIIEGYWTYRQLEQTELGALLEAIRFGAAFRAVRYAAPLVQDGWNEIVERRFARERDRFDESEGIAQHAHASIEHLL